MPAMIGARRFIGGSPYSVEAKTLFAAMTTPPLAARKRQIDTLIRALKAAGVWTLLDVLYVLAAADSQAARLNWKNPGTFDAVAVSSPVFAADRGYTGDGSTARLRTQYTPSVNGVQTTQNSASLWVWSLTNAALDPQEAGNSTVGSVNTRLATLTSTNVATSRLNSSATVGVSNASSLGLIGTSLASSTVQKFWRNGVQIGTDQATTTTGLANGEQWICGSNSSTFSTKQIAAAAWGAALTGKEAALYAALLTYHQAVGAA